MQRALRRSCELESGLAVVLFSNFYPWPGPWVYSFSLIVFRVNSRTIAYSIFTHGHMRGAARRGVATCATTRRVIKAAYKRKKSID